MASAGSAEQAGPARPAGGRDLLHNVQALRAVAALLVVLYHCRDIAAPLGIEARQLAFGRGGVDLFFVISGFIMVHVTHGRPAQPLRFALDRITRIVPLYWIVTLAFTALLLLTPSFHQTARPGVAEVLKSLFFVPFQNTRGFGQPVFFAGWTLNYEMFFYAVFALGLSLRRGPIFVIAVMCVLAALHPFASAPMLRVYTDPVILEFVAGMVIALLHRRLDGRGGLPLLLLGFALLAVLPTFAEGHRALLFGPPAALILLGALQMERSKKRIPGLRLLGDASYSIYLTHFVMAVAAHLAFERFPQSPLLSLLIIVGALVGSGVLGILVHRLLEKPATRLLRRRRGRSEAETAAASW